MGGKFFRLTLVAVILAAGFTVANPTPTAAASCSDISKLEQQISSLEKQLNQAQSNVQQTQKQANGLQSAISAIDTNINTTTGHINTTQGQIQSTQSVIDGLTTNIQTTQTQLSDLQGKLNNAYSNLYELSQTSTVELVLQSKSIDDLLNQSQYIQALQVDLQKNITQANSLEADLQSQKQTNETQKASLQSQKDQLTSENNALNGQKNQKTNLLKQTNGQEAAYQSLVQQLKNQDQVANQQLSNLFSQLSGCNGEMITGGTGGYPWASSPNQVDPWGFYTGQCTSFAAFRFNGFFGAPFNDTRPGSGSAWNWPALAGDQSYHTSKTARVFSVVSWPTNSFMPFGHVAWVTAVHPNGTIDVEEYNWARPLNYDQRFNVTPSNYGSATYIFQ